MGLAATAMFCWAGLLIWADRKPVERCGILIPTIAVVVGLLATSVYAVTSDIFTLQKIIPKTVMGIVLIALFSFSYFNASNAEPGSQ